MEFCRLILSLGAGKGKNDKFKYQKGIVMWGKEFNSVLIQKVAKLSGRGTNFWRHGVS